MTSLDIRNKLATPTATQKTKNIVSWGSVGSGKSSLAVNLSFELAASGWQVCLIDADTYHPSLAALMGVTEAGGGLAGCLRLIRQGRFTDLEFERLGKKIEFSTHSIWLLTGLPSPARWAEVDAPTLQGLISHLSGQFDFLIWDVATHLEAGLISADSGRDRNQATQFLLTSADLVLASFLADPVGINRFLFDLREVGKPVWPIANRVRSSILGRNPQSQLRSILSRAAGLTLAGEIAEDEGFDILLQSTKPLQLQGRSSKAQQGIRKLAQEIVVAVGE